MSSGPRPRAHDPAFDEKLEEFRRLYEADEAFPNVVAAWEAIELILERNSRSSEQGEAPYLVPGWVNEYLRRCAGKIGRLWLGIRPQDDRPLPSMDFNEVGHLRKVRQADRDRDDRINHLPAALGFVRQGVSAFRRHDRALRDDDYLRIYDDPDTPRDVRQALVRIMMKNENIGTEEAVRNRLSKARRQPRKHNQTSLPSR